MYKCIYKSFLFFFKPKPCEYVWLFVYWCVFPQAIRSRLQQFVEERMQTTMVQKCFLWKAVFSLNTFPCEQKDNELAQTDCTDYVISGRHRHVWVERYTQLNQIAISCSIFASIICSITDVLFCFVKSSCRQWFFFFQFSCNIR